MLFPSAVFLFAFLPFVLLVYYLSPRSWRNSILLVASLFFYAWGETVYVLLMLVSVAANYGFGLALDRADPQRRKRWLAAAMVFNLGLLVVYKYSNFLVDNLNLGLALIGMHAIHLDPVHLPLGISFFTFQAMSYVIDVYRFETRAQERFANVALYISLFPQLIAGPIVRYHDVAEQIISRLHDPSLFVSGVRRFVIGLAKKLIIANACGAAADAAFAVPAAQLGTGLAWLGIICYALQIYFDFSAYSDMAIGLGRMFGFRFLENFNYPYIATSLQDFWRRWHMSLSRWFRDYLYFSLGGNRISPRRTYVNLCIVFLLCGFWHGAAWNFVVWGALHGSFLALERAGLGALLQRMPRLLRHLYTLTVVLVGWIYFRADSLAHANHYLLALGGWSGERAVPGTVTWLLDPELVLTLVLGTVLSTPIYRWLSTQLLQPRLQTGGPIYLAWQFALVFGLLLVSASYVAATTYNPFIYFRF